MYKINSNQSTVIVDTQTIDVMLNGVPSKQLQISYFDHNNDLQMLYYNVPAEDLFNWGYASAGDVVVPNYRSWDGKPVKKVYGKNRPYINPIRTHEIMIEMFEKYPETAHIADLALPDLSYCDIEVDVDESGFPDAESANNPVNTICWVHKNVVTVLGRANLTQKEIASIQRRIDEHCKTFKHSYQFIYRYFETERALIESFFFEYVKPCPALTGWNFLGYDWLYMYNRAQKLQICIDSISQTGSWKPYNLVNMFNSPERKKVMLPMHKLVFDYMEVYFKWDQRITPKESYKLDDVGDAAIGVKKVQHSEGFMEMWRDHKEDYVFYNAIDGILVREIDLELQTAPTFFALASAIKTDMMTAFSPVNSLQHVQAEYELKNNVVFPKNMEDDKSENDEGYEGAFVFEPIPGVYKNVIALDFASLYPTTMRQFNISPDTFIKKDKDKSRKTTKPDQIKCCTGATYMRNVEGFMPRILSDFYKKRKGYKKEMKAVDDEVAHLKQILEQRLQNNNNQQ